MKKFEYHLHEIEFKPGNEFLLKQYFNDFGKSSWELVLIQPLQTISNEGILTGRPPVIKVTFLCVFKRRKTWFWNLINKRLQKKYTRYGNFNDRTVPMQ